MTAPRPVRAVLFDLDGTLVDSEGHTDEAIRAVLRATEPRVSRCRTPRHTDAPGLHVADVIRERTKIDVDPAVLADELLACWTALATDVTPIPGAQEAVRAAARRLKLGVVSGSPRSVIDSFLTKLAVADCVEPRARIGGDAVNRSKPDPEGYLLGARALGVEPAESIVFEDSLAGLMAARAAGMQSVFVTCRAADIPAGAALATASCTHYRALPSDFWDMLADGRLDLTGRSFI